MCLATNINAINYWCVNGMEAVLDWPSKITGICQVGRWYFWAGAEPRQYHPQPDGKFGPARKFWAGKESGQQTPTPSDDGKFGPFR